MTLKLPIIKKNIAIRSSEYPIFENKGGIASFSYNLAKILSSQNYKVHIITYDGMGKNKKAIFKNKLIIHTVPYKTNNKIFNFLYYRFPLGLLRKMLYANKHHMLIERLDWKIFSYFEFRRLHKKFKFAVVHASSFDYPTFAALFFRRTIPFICHVQSIQQILNRFENSDLDHRAKAWIESLDIQYLSTQVVACSQIIQRLLLNLYPKISKKTSYIYNAIYAKSYRNKNPINKNNIVFVGRLDYRKGTDILLNSFLQLAHHQKHLQLWLIGQNMPSFPSKKGYINFESYIQNKQIPFHILKRIHILPRIDNKKELIRLLQDIKGIGVFPSRHEPFGYVYIEAMALGYITIASSYGAGSEIIDKNINGFLTLPNTKNLSATIKTVFNLTNTELYAISERAVQKVLTHFDYNQARKQYNNFYTKLFS